MAVTACGASRLAAVGCLYLALAGCSSSPAAAPSSATTVPGSAANTTEPTTVAPTVPSTTASGTPVTAQSIGPATSSPEGTTPLPPWASRVQLTPGTSWQWQLGGGTVNETVLDHVDNPKKMYDIDLFTTDAAVIDRLHAKGITVICYMETGGWESYRPDAAQYPEAVLGAGVEGYPDERFVDIRQIDTLLPILTARLDLAASKGCDGVEPDLDDTYNGYTTGFPLTMADQLAFNRAVADAAHTRGLSIGLKNGATADGSFERAMSEFTDWALNEECNTYDECAGYSAFIDQNRAVFQVEYTIPDGTRPEDFCPQDNAANFDGLLKASSDSLAALPRVACRLD